MATCCEIVVTQISFLHEKKLLTWLPFFVAVINFVLVLFFESLFNASALISFKDAHTTCILITKLAAAEQRTVSRHTPGRGKKIGGRQDKVWLMGHSTPFFSFFCGMTRLYWGLRRLWLNHEKLKLFYGESPYVTVRREKRIRRNGLPATWAKVSF